MIFYFYFHYLRRLLKYFFHSCSCEIQSNSQGGILSVMFAGPPTIQKWEKHGKTKKKTLKCLQFLRKCGAIKTVSTFLHRSCQTCWFQPNVGFGFWWLHFFLLRCFMVNDSHAHRYNSAAHTAKTQPRTQVQLSHAHRSNSATHTDLTQPRTRI